MGQTMDSNIDKGVNEIAERYKMKNLVMHDLTAFLEYETFSNRFVWLQNIGLGGMLSWYLVWKTVRKYNRYKTTIKKIHIMLDEKEIKSTKTSKITITGECMGKLCNCTVPHPRHDNNIVCDYCFGTIIGNVKTKTVSVLDSYIQHYGKCVCKTKIESTGDKMLCGRCGKTIIHEDYVKGTVKHSGCEKEDGSGWCTSTDNCIEKMYIKPGVYGCFKAV